MPSPPIVPTHSSPLIINFVDPKGVLRILFSDYISIKTYIFGLLMSADAASSS